MTDTVPHLVIRVYKEDDTLSRGLLLQLLLGDYHPRNGINNVYIRYILDIFKIYSIYHILCPKESYNTPKSRNIHRSRLSF